MFIKGLLVFSRTSQRLAWCIYSYDCLKRHYEKISAIEIKFTKERIEYLKNAVTFFNKLNVIGPSSGLSNKILKIFVAQGAAKLP